VGETRRALLTYGQLSHVEDAHKGVAARDPQLPRARLVDAQPFQLDGPRATPHTQQHVFAFVGVLVAVGIPKGEEEGVLVRGVSS
jgi:hypothetical protein